jgi:hypothetical protein
MPLQRTREREIRRDALSASPPVIAGSHRHEVYWYRLPGERSMASELVRYLAGHGTDARGRTAADVIALPDQELETSHDWVQWLFPLPTRSSAVPGSPILSEADIAAIKSDPVAIETLERAVDRMIAFYQRTDHWLQRYDHNHLRITRMLQSISLLSGPSAARKFFDWLMALHDSAGAPVNATSLQYWRDALRAR